MQSVYLQRIMKKNADKGYEKTNPIQSQFQTRSEFIPKGAEITTGELLGILKPGTNFKPSASLSRHTKNFSHTH